MLPGVFGAVLTLEEGNVCESPPPFTLLSLSLSLSLFLWDRMRNGVHHRIFEVTFFGLLLRLTVAIDPLSPSHHLSFFSVLSLSSLCLS